MTEHNPVLTEPVITVHFFGKAVTGTLAEWRQALRDLSGRPPGWTAVERREASEAIKAALAAAQREQE